MASLAANKQVIEAFFVAMNSGERDAVVACFANDGSVWSVGTHPVSGRIPRAEIPKATDSLFDLFEGILTFTILSMIAEEDKVAAEVTSRGTLHSGKVYENQYHFLFVLRDGKIVEMKEYTDTERITQVLFDGVRPSA